MKRDGMYLCKEKLPKKKKKKNYSKCVNGKGKSIHLWVSFLEWTSHLPELLKQAQWPEIKDRMMTKLNSLSMSMYIKTKNWTIKINTYFLNRLTWLKPFSPPYETSTSFKTFDCNLCGHINTCTSLCCINGCMHLNSFPTANEKVASLQLLINWYLGRSLIFTFQERSLELLRGEGCNKGNLGQWNTETKVATGDLWASKRQEKVKTQNPL